MIAKPGSRWRSDVCDCEVVVVRGPTDDVTLACGGAPLIAIDATPSGSAPTDEFSAGTLVGKRYVDADGTVELLCTKPGAGTLAMDGVALTTKDAKPLPSSD